MGRIDWAFTDDGDLDLGAPKVDVEGEFLYIHPDGTESTDKGEDGRLIRDIAYRYGYDADKTVILNRLMTDSPDWFHHPSMGGNLTDLIGEPNTRETAELGAQYIRQALMYAGLFDFRDIDVKPVPVSHREIAFMITVNRVNDDPYQFPLVFNLEHGVLNYYEKPE